MFWPCETRTSTCRNLATISSGLYRFLAITVLLDVKDIPQVGPLQWGWITGTHLHFCGLRIQFDEKSRIPKESAIKFNPEGIFWASTLTYFLSLYCIFSASAYRNAMTGFVRDNRFDEDAFS